MDLFAYMLGERDIMTKYVKDNYGPVPRYRGVRLMRYETPETCKDMGSQSDLWAEMCGKDVIYFHTRCGGDNYDAYGKAWEQKLKDKFISSIDDTFDPTYRDHYFTAVLDDTYNTLCKEYEEGTLI